jgi:N,N-dimethylformamidase beta subunit-like, C-terminal
MPDESKKTNRRELLKGALAAGTLAGLSPQSLFADDPSPVAKPVRAPDLIRAENQKPGTKDGLLTKTRIDRKTKWRCPWIEGYCSRTSIRAGERLKIMVSTNPSSPFVLDIFRLGFYGGNGGRLMRQFGSLAGRVQPDPETGHQRLRECRWDPAVEFVIPNDWPSGVYLGKLTAEREGLQSYVIFIVRDDRPCDFLFQCSDATWLAYNRWSGNWSMYNDGKKNWYCGPNVQVSWDRPYGKYPVAVDTTPMSQGSGEFLIWEFPLAYWMEKEGYDVSYISNVDTHTAGVAGLLRAKAFLSVGHDEYWSREMYDNMMSAVSQGLSAGFLSGDTCWGLIPFLPSGSWVPNRIITRVGRFGEDEPLSIKKYPETALFKQSAPTEANLIGARNVFPYCGIADWTCSDEDHWIFAGTGMKNGDGIPNLLGFEWMGQPAEHIPGLRVVAKGPVEYEKVKGEYAATIYPGPKENWVFNAGSIWWCDGLSAPPGYQSPSLLGVGPKGPDPRAQRIATNLFNRFLGTA